jgi:hypothetical protein
MGEKDEALTQLEIAFDMRKKKQGVNGLKQFVQMHVLKDEDLASLKDHPGFQAIIERALAGGGSSIPDGSM